MRVQEHYDVLFCEPYKYRPWEIGRLTDDQIERILEAGVRREKEIEARMPRADGQSEPAETGGLRKFIADGGTPTFEQLWSGIWSKMPGLTREKAKVMYEKQLSKHLEMQNQKREGDK